MIDKTNIKIESKNTKKIKYYLNLDRDYWSKQEFDSRGNALHYRDIIGVWYEYGDGNSNMF